MVGFSNNKYEYNTSNLKSNFSNIEFKNYNYVSSNYVSSDNYSNSGSNSSTNVETVDLVDEEELSSDSSNDNIPKVKIEEVTDFSSKEYSDSVIAKYMKQHGDVNGDGKVDINDVTNIQKFLVEKGTLNNGKGDLDGDGRVSIKDATIIQDYITNKKFSVSNINIANRLDKIKYQDEISQTDKELDEIYDKYYEMDFSVKYYAKKKQLQNSPTYSSNTTSHSHLGGWHDGYVGGKRKTYKSSSKSGEPHFPAHEAGQKQKFFYNLYKSKKASAGTEAEAIKEYGSLKKARDAYEEKINALKYKKKLLEEKAKLSPYENMMSTAEFKKWANKQTFDSFDPKKNNKLMFISKYMDSYKYMDASQIAMYNYLLDTKGKDEANKLIDILQDNINKTKGYEKAQDFIKKLDVNFKKIIKDDGKLMDDSDVKKLEDLVEQKKYDKKYDMNDDGKLDNTDIDKLNQYIQTGGEIETTFKNMQISFNGGFADGWKKFFDGLGYLINDDGILSADEYKMMYIGQMLQQNGVISGSYEFGNTVGNMMPVIIASAIATAISAPFGGEGGGAVFTIGSTAVTASQIGKCTAAAFIFASTTGNSKHEALCNGHSLASSIGYGVLCGLSEAGLETALGSIPFVGKESRSMLVSMFREGLSESAQELASSVIGYYTLGEEIDISDLSANMGKAFVMGAMLSGVGNVGKGVANMKVLINGVKYELTGAQIMAYYKASVDPKTGKSNGLTLQQYIAENLSSDSKAATNTNIMTVDQISSMSQYECSDAISKIFSENNSGKLSKVDITNLRNLMNHLDSETRTATLNKMSSANLLTTLKVLNSAGDIKLLNTIFDSSNTNTQYMTTLTKTLLEPTLDYYENAAKIAGNLSEFKTYRSHTEGHVREVAIKTMEAVNNIKTSLKNSDVNGFSSDVNIYECYVAALWHDVGMAAGSEGMLSYDSKVVDGKIVTEPLKETKNGKITRNNHSFNSAINVLANSGEIAALGVDPNNVALLTFAHSKSNSGVSVLNNAKDWSLCVDKINSAVEYHNQTHPDSKIVFSNTGGTNFIESLIKSGILKDDSTTTSTSSTKQGNVTHNVYNFDPAKLSALSSETYAIRLGDANTNNNNIGTNQAGEKIDMSSFKRKGKTSFDTSSGFDNIGSLVDKEATGSTINIGSDNVTLDTYGAAYILGEANIDFSTDVSSSGSLTERFTIKNPNEYPASTVFNIDERLGEIDTAKKGGFLTKIEICLSSKGVPESAKPQIEAYYKAFAESRGYDPSGVVWV